MNVARESGRRSLGEGGPTPELRGRTAQLTLTLCLFLIVSTNAFASDPPPVEPVEPVVPTITGNAAFTSDALRAKVAAEMRSFVEENFDETWVEDAGDRIRRFYLQEGYPDVAVTTRVAPNEGDGSPAVTIAIVEGPFVTLGNVSFRGNENVDRAKLDSFVTRDGSVLGGADRFVRSRIEDDFADIRAYYVGLGYLDAIVELQEVRRVEDGTVAEVLVRIVEGPMTRLGEVTLVGVEREPLDAMRGAALRRVELGSPYTHLLPYAIRSRLIEAYGARGYPFVEIEFDVELTTDPAIANLTFAIEEGAKTNVREIRVEGLDRTREYVVTREIEMRVGDVWNGDAVRTGRRALLRTGFFESVRITPVPIEGETDRVDLLVEVIERDPDTLDLYVGWGSWDMARAGAAYTIRNLWGTGRRFRLSLEGSLRGAAVDARLTDPWFLGERLEAEIDLAAEQRENVSYSFREVVLTAALKRALTEEIEARLSWSLRLSKTFDVADGLDDTQEESLEIAIVGLGLTKDSRNDVVNPSRGGITSLLVEVADPLVGGDVSFWRLTADVRRYFALDDDKRWILATAARAGYAVPYGDTKSVPLRERFLSGGSTTVRTFAEQELGPERDGDPLGGEAYVTFNAELRFPIYSIVRGAVFADAGNNVLDAEDFGLNGLRYAVGGGLRIDTPIGPLRVDTAWNPDRQHGENAFCIFVAVGFPF